MMVPDFSVFQQGSQKSSSQKLTSSIILCTIFSARWTISVVPLILAMRKGPLSSAWLLGRQQREREKEKDGDEEKEKKGKRGKNINIFFPHRIFVLVITWWRWSRSIRNIFASQIGAHMHTPIIYIYIYIRSETCTHTCIELHASSCFRLDAFNSFTPSSNHTTNSNSRNFDAHFLRLKVFEIEGNITACNPTCHHFGLLKRKKERKRERRLQIAK